MATNHSPFGIAHATVVPRNFDPEGADADEALADEADADDPADAETP